MIEKRTGIIFTAVLTITALLVFYHLYIFFRVKNEQKKILADVMSGRELVVTTDAYSLFPVCDGILPQESYRKAKCFLRIAERQGKTFTWMDLSSREVKNEDLCLKIGEIPAVYSDERLKRAVELCDAFDKNSMSGNNASAAEKNHNSFPIGINEMREYCTAVSAPDLKRGCLGKMAAVSGEAELCEHAGEGTIKYVDEEGEGDKAEFSLRDYCLAGCGSEGIGLDAAAASRVKNIRDMQREMESVCAMIKQSDTLADEAMRNICHMKIADMTKDAAYCGLMTSSSAEDMLQKSACYFKNYAYARGMWYYRPWSMRQFD